MTTSIKTTPTILSKSATTTTGLFYFLETTNDLEARLSTSAHEGLPLTSVAPLQARDGPNELIGGGSVSPWSILAAQGTKIFFLAGILS